MAKKKAKDDANREPVDHSRISVETGVDLDKMPLSRTANTGDLSANDDRGDRTREMNFDKNTDITNDRRVTDPTREDTDYTGGQGLLGQILTENDTGRHSDDLAV